MSVRLNPQELARRLEDHGVPAAQAQAHVDVLRDALLGGLAAREDITALAEDVEKFSAQLDAVKHAGDVANQGLRSDLDAWRVDLEQRLDVLTAVANALTPQNQRRRGGAVWWFLGGIGLLGVMAACFMVGVLATDELIALLSSPFGGGGLRQ